MSTRGLSRTSVVLCSRLTQIVMTSNSDCTKPIVQRVNPVLSIGPPSHPSWMILIVHRIASPTKYRPLASSRRIVEHGNIRTGSYQQQQSTPRPHKSFQREYWRRAEHDCICDRLLCIQSSHGNIGEALEI